MSVLTLHIRPEEADQYLARVFEGKRLIDVPTLHSGIAQAIEAYGERDADGDGFSDVDAFDIWYGGWSVGAVPRLLMRTEALQLANRLLALSALVR